MSRENIAGNEPLVCNLPGNEFAIRRTKVQEFVERARLIESTHTGLRFVFCNTSETAHALVDFILFEQKCCSAITYELQSLPPHKDLVLQLGASGKLLGSLQALYAQSGARTGRLP